MKILRILNDKISEWVALVSSAGAADADKVVATDSNGRLDPTLMPGGSPVNTSAGAGDAGKLPKLDASGKLDTTFMPAGLGADSRSVVASEALSAGDLVNLWNNAGTLNVRKADATTAGKEAVGYVTAAVASSAAATVYFDGTISGLSGMTVGALQYLATTAGGRTETGPSATGNVLQCVGVAASATELVFEAGTPVVRA